jgi:hypothetical protein
MQSTYFSYINQRIVVLAKEKLNKLSYNFKNHLKYCLGAGAEGVCSCVAIVPPTGLQISIQKKLICKKKK